MTPTTKVCEECPAHKFVVDSLNSTSRLLRWFIATFLVALLSGMCLVWESYSTSDDVDRKLEVYMAGQQERLLRIQQMIERNEQTLARIDESLRRSVVAKE